MVRYNNFNEAKGDVLHRFEIIRKDRGNNYDDVEVYLFVFNKGYVIQILDGEYHEYSILYVYDGVFKDRYIGITPWYADFIKEIEHTLCSSPS